MCIRVQNTLARKARNPDHVPVQVGVFIHMDEPMSAAESLPRTLWSRNQSPAGKEFLIFPGIGVRRDDVAEFELLVSAPNIPGLNPKSLRSASLMDAYGLSIETRLSDTNVNLKASLVVSTRVGHCRHRVSLSPSLVSMAHTLYHNRTRRALISSHT